LPRTRRLLLLISNEIFEALRYLVCFPHIITFKPLQKVVISIIIPVSAFHSLRHSFGSLVQQTQRDIRITQQLMNHKSIQMTERYMHSRSEARMEAVNSLDWDLHNKKSPMSVEGDFECNKSR
jgi:hypothetical protein